MYVALPSVFFSLFHGCPKLLYNHHISFACSLLSCHRERMKLPFMSDQCEQMLKICNEFVRLQVSYDEYLCMKVLLLLSTGNKTLF